jgi:hypothetical protein
VTLQDPQAAGVVAGNQQRHPHAHLGHRGQELRGQVQVLPDVAGVSGELGDADHGWCAWSHGGASGSVASPDRGPLVDSSSMAVLLRSASTGQRTRGGERGRPAPCQTQPAEVAPGKTALQCQIYWHARRQEGPFGRRTRMPGPGGRTPSRRSAPQRCEEGARITGQPGGQDVFPARVSPKPAGSAPAGPAT